MITLRLVAAVAFALSPLAANAATYTPTRFDDPAPNGCLPSDCSLREAVIAANGTVAADTIALAIGTYRLTRTTGDSPSSFDLDVTKPLTIQGSTGGRSTIENDAATVGLDSRVLDASGTTLTLRRVHLRGGDVGIYAGSCLNAVNSTLTLVDSTVAVCEGGGSAVAAHGSWVTLTNSQVYRNVGGGIQLRGTGLSLVDSSVYQNEATQGGGITLMPGEASTVSAIGTSEIWGNRADIGGGIYMKSANGGGVYGQAGGWLVVRDNEAIYGGGIAGEPYHLRLENVALVDNVAEEGGGLWASSVTAERLRVEGNMAQIGGGAYIDCDWCSIQRATFADNVAVTDGGGIYVQGENYLRLVNVSSYNNSAARGGGIATRTLVEVKHYTSWLDEADLGPTLAGLEGNLYPFLANVESSALLMGCASVEPEIIRSFAANAQLAGTPSCQLIQPTDMPALTQAQVAPVVGDFGDNMRVVGLNVGSVLAGATSRCQPRDVRGYNRPAANCDIGAFELGGLVP
jgi:predicted outer membrane repeat protein